MAKASFRDVLVKASKLFTSDAYLINNQYLMAGPESEENNPGYYLLKLSPSIIEICNELFDNNKIYYISSVKNAKDKLSENYNEENMKNQISLIKEKVSRIESLINKTDVWNKINLSEEKINKLYNENISIEFFDENEEIPSMTVSKCLFPLVTEKSINDGYYNIFFNENKNYISLLFSFDYPLFQIYTLYQYISLN